MRAYPSFELNTTNGATAVAFSPVASVLYIATTGEAVVAINSDGTEYPSWSTAVPDSDLCGIVLSPDGLSVYVLGCTTSTVFHVRLEATTGVVVSTTTYTADSSVDSSTSGDVFLVEATELVVLVGRPDSDEVVLFQRDSSTGALSSGTTIQLNNLTKAVSGAIAAFVMSTATDKLFVSVAASDNNGGLVVLGVTCYPSTPSPSQPPTPAPTPAPTISPSPAPTQPPTPGPSTAQTLSPTPAPSAIPTPAPTMLSQVPELVEVRLAAAVHGIDLIFEPGRGSSGICLSVGERNVPECDVANSLKPTLRNRHADSYKLRQTKRSTTAPSTPVRHKFLSLFAFGNLDSLLYIFTSGLWCSGNICSTTTCDVADLLDSESAAAAGDGVFCSWKNDTTVVVTFGFTLAENGTVALNGDSEYISGCIDCTEYASGSAVILPRLSPPRISTARLTDTGAKVVVYFNGNPTSQEINGTYDSVPCESVFNPSSASKLGAGNACQFVSSSSMQVTLGFQPSILPTSTSNCTDGDDTSLTLMADVVRTEIGAFLTSSSGCVAVDYPASPDPPFVAISAPNAIGYCDDLFLEGSATFPSIGSVNLTWTVDLEGNDSAADVSNMTRFLEEAAARNKLTVTIPSEYMPEERSFIFRLRVDTALGGSAEVGAVVYKSSVELLVSKVVGPSVLQRTRGSPITLRGETSLSSCSTLSVDDAFASFSWNLVSANESVAREAEVSAEIGRDPRVLVIAPYTLGFAGSTYQFQLESSFGGVSNTANVTVEVISGPVFASFTGGTKRSIGPLLLNASASVDDDAIDFLPFVFSWHCEDEIGAACIAPNGDILDIQNFADGGLLSISAGVLPIAGVDYTFVVTASKGFEGGQAWSQYRSDNASCVVSTTAENSPHVSVTPKVRQGTKQSASSRIVLNGCAAGSVYDACRTSAILGTIFEWREVDDIVDISDGWSSAYSTAPSASTLVIRAGVLAPGRRYTFSLTATDSSGSGYAGKRPDGRLFQYSFETNTTPVGGYINSDLLQITAGQDKVLLQAMAWTDDFEDLPMAYEFGYVHGWVEVSSVSSAQLVTKLSSAASSSSFLHTHIPPGTASSGFNVTIVAFVSDLLGATAATSLGMHSAPLVIVSTSPDQVSVSRLRANISSLSSGDGHLLIDPADALRDITALSAVMMYAPEPESAEDLAEFDELKETIVLSVIEVYFALDSSSTAADAGTGALATAVASVSASGQMNDTTQTAVSRAVVDMMEVETSAGKLLGSRPAVSLLQTVSALVGGEYLHSPETAVDEALVGKEAHLDLLGNLGRAVATGAEAGEDLSTITTGSVGLKAGKFAASSISMASVTVGQNRSRVSFEDWTASGDVEDSSTIVIAVTSLGDTVSEELQEITTINAWDSAEEPLQALAYPVKFYAYLNVSNSSSWGTEESIPTCAYWSESNNTWLNDGTVLESFNVDPDGSGTVSCSTYHLSAYTVAGAESVPGDWNFFDLLEGSDVVREYGAESWPAILFLSLVVTLFLVPATTFYWQDIKRGHDNEYINVLRSAYLDKGRCSRADQPVKARVSDCCQRARKRLNRTKRYVTSAYSYMQVTYSTPSEKYCASRADQQEVGSSIFTNHAWGHLRDSPADHFNKILLTRSQHLIILLADWMSALTLQAVFYGKSQFSVQEKVQMAVVTALFMMPTAVVFPALLRLANTPPASDTLVSAERAQYQIESERLMPPRASVKLRSEYEETLERKDEDFMKALGRGENNVFPTAFSNTSPSRPRPTVAVSLILSSVNLNFHTTLNTSRHKTVLYSDVVSLQKGMAVSYTLLPVWLGVLISMVMRDAETQTSSGGGETALLHNMTASLAIACLILSIVSAGGTAAHDARIMTQAMALQAVVGPGLVACGAVLFGSDAVLATGAVVGGLGTLVCSYFVRLQRKNEQALDDLLDDDLTTAWSTPSMAVQSAAEVLQSAFRVHRAAVRTRRAREFDAWLRKCKLRRYSMHLFVNSVIYLTIACLAYVNLVFAARFDRPTCNNWLTTCVIALLVEATVQQPVVLLMSGVLGDFVEESANYLLELMDF
ncbi:unnamed protein product [Pylaiella littoralis]